MAETTITEDPLERRPVRDFKFRSAFALSFADLSPIVGIYTVGPGSSAVVGQVLQPSGGVTRTRA